MERLRQELQELKAKLQKLREHRSELSTVTNELMDEAEKLQDLLTLNSERCQVTEVSLKEVDRQEHAIGHDIRNLLDAIKSDAIDLKAKRNKEDEVMRALSQEVNDFAVEYEEPNMEMGAEGKAFPSGLKDDGKKNKKRKK